MSNVSHAKLGSYFYKVMAEIAGQVDPDSPLYSPKHAYEQVKLEDVPQAHRALIHAAIARDPSIQSSPGVIDTARLRGFLDGIRDSFVEQDERRGFLGMFGGNEDMKTSTKEATAVFRQFGEAARILYETSEAQPPRAPVNVRPSLEQIARDKAIATAVPVDLAAPRGRAQQRELNYLLPQDDMQQAFARTSPQLQGMGLANHVGGKTLSAESLAAVAEWSNGNLLISPDEGHGYSSLKLYVPAGSELTATSPNPGFEVVSPALPPPEGQKPGGRWLWLSATAEVRGGSSRSAGDTISLRLSLPGQDPVNLSLTAVSLLGD